ncbi:MAG: excinuclease ABC subunit UvrA [Myxococcota bacterium]|nr:excinuclease ABC subunit UvrA [Myxococcota bacterium]
MTTGPGDLQVRGAREHNLKSIDVRIPRNKLVVITGLSGSGKSSLAFDTIYAEGQRRYVESLSAYARQFLDQMSKPDVDSIEGLSPAISIEQKTTSRNPRSTVGTVTEIYDYLRLLYARIGLPHCVNCDKPIAAQTVQQMVDRVLALRSGTRIQVLAPVVRDRKGEYRRELREFARQGFVRVRIDGEIHDLDSLPTLDRKKRHSIDLVVDRVVVKAEARGRIADSLETALAAAEGYATVDVGPGREEIPFSENAACVDCGASYPEINPRMFSFNNPHGACPECAGLGTRDFFDPDLIVPDSTVSISDGAIVPFRRRGRASGYYNAMLAALSEQLGFDLEVPWSKLPARARRQILNGTGETPIEFHFGRRRKFSVKRPWMGVVAHLDRRYRETEADAVREDLRQYMTMTECPECQGARLRPEARAVRVAERRIHEITSLPIGDAVRWFESIDLPAQDREIADRLLREIRERLCFLNDVGLEYLALDRGSSTLSGGEGQRIRLATQVGSALVGVIYILDEPSIGLHARDNDRLLRTLFSLRDLGNTVVVVEHDASTILRSDHVIDLGPRAGIHGGEVVAEGTPKQIMRSSRSLTGAYLSGKRAIEVPTRRRPGSDRFLTLVGASANNLRDITVRVPIGVLTVVTGVSGSGKSTLVNDTLYPALAQKLYGSKERPGRHRRIHGIDYLDKVIDVNQAPIGRTSRSNPSTYTGIFTGIRDLFAQLPESRVRGYKPGRFSFNVKGGRCEACEGGGIIRIEMHFLPDVFVTCEECAGRRYNRETLEILFKGKSIADVLDMTVDEAFDFLEHIPSVRNGLRTLAEVGLGYLHLGQQATTLSGGEAQRIKLARELSKRATGRTAYILDEPTTGLHFADVEKLLEVLTRLVDRDNTVVVIEHNLDVIKTADHIIDLGPEGGDKGGEVVATGTPEEVANNPLSFTGQALHPVLFGR